MEVFLVLTHYMHGIQEEGVFLTREAAEANIKKRGGGGNPQVDRAFVRGRRSADSPLKTVYTASTYDRTLDVHHYEGVYFNYEDAKNAAGKDGLKLTRQLS